jgi:hypothetical protein
MKKQFRDFESAREFARALKLKGRKEWREYCKSGNKPDDIPVGVEKTYKNDFKGIGDFLGTGNIASSNKKFRSFAEAREFVQKLGLKRQQEWEEYSKSGNKPDDIPSAPYGTYKNEFKGLGDWLGTGTVAPKDRVYRPFTEAREFVRALNFKNSEEWHAYCKSGNKPNNIPADPNYPYKNDFKGMGDWLGNGNTRDYKSFTEAREFVRSLRLKNNGKWREYCKSDDMPNDIPSHPDTNYKNEWKGYGDWLGNGNTRDFKTFTEAREFVRKLVLKGPQEWHDYCKSGNKPDYIPNRPDSVYKNKWKSWGSFFGTGYVAPKDRVYRPYKEAREFVRKLNLKGQKEWYAYCKSGNKPDDIPTYPWEIYKKWNKK